MSLNKRKINSAALNKGSVGINFGTFSGSIMQFRQQVVAANTYSNIITFRQNVVLRSVNTTNNIMTIRQEVRFKLAGKNVVIFRQRVE